MCDHRRIGYELFTRPVCLDCGLLIIDNPRGQKFCDHHHSVLVRVHPDPDKQDGVINPRQAKFILYCPDCGNFVDYIQRDADHDVDEPPF